MIMNAHVISGKEQCREVGGVGWWRQSCYSGSIIYTPENIIAVLCVCFFSLCCIIAVVAGCFFCALLDVSSRDRGRGAHGATFLVSSLRRGSICSSELKGRRFLVHRDIVA